MEKEEQRKNFRAISGFKEHDIMLKKEQSVLKSVMDAFEGENMQTEYSVLGYKIDLYFHDYKLAIEVDEKGHKDRNIDHEIRRQKTIKEELGCEFIRIYPDEENSNIFKAINEIHRHIKESIKKPTKESLMNKLSNKLLRLEFKSNNSIKTKCLISYNIKMKLRTYCLACRKQTNNIASRKVTMTNKMVRDKSGCSECLSDKSSFLKQKPNKKSGR